MNEDQSISLLWAVGALVLLASAFIGRKVEFGKTIKMAAFWVAIFVLLFAVFSFGPEFSNIWERIKSTATGTIQQNSDGKTLRIQMAQDGHFWVNTKVNGKAVTFLIDSGATTTLIAYKAAKLADVEPDTLRSPITVSTANGEIQVRRARIDSLEVSDFSYADVPVLVQNDNGDDVSLLGMNFLSELKSWRVSGNEMIFEY